VYWWCVGSAITAAGEWDTSQFQLKLRLGVTANPRGTIGVDVGTTAPSGLRVLVPYSEDFSWSPPSKTAAAGDKPVCVYIDGVPYWAIPPNVNDDAQKGPDGSFNFASHWDPGEWGHPDGILSPGEYLGDASHSEEPALPNQRGRSSTDLVFTVPVSAASALFGIALFDTGSKTEPSTWTLLDACQQVNACLNNNNRRDPSTF
jgi:hypothetical protein